MRPDQQTSKINPRSTRPRRRPLYRTVLSIAVAAVVGAWLPFSVMYVNAVTKQPAHIAIVQGKGRTVVTSRTSGAAAAQPSPAGQQPTFVSTRSSDG